ncbi:MAG: DUF1800 domain-containing protein [Crocinitomicaceae bacterium]|nr:DUF1800 domain-containing protein [Crocinitomicaceae bacterium]
MQLTKKQIQHFYWRAGFGIGPKELDSLKGSTKTEIIDRLFKKSEVFQPLVLDFEHLKIDKKELSREEKKVFRKLQNKSMFDLSLHWFNHMTNTEQVLREKIVFFFHDHFAVRIKSPIANLHLNNIIRKHALGSFGEMLMEVSKSPAMISFLNNKQNKKDRPNENFAREVMELFSLGRDNVYTETDIKEAARAFTGWSYTQEGKFVFKQKQHDTGSKTFLGRTGNFTGDDIIRILLEEKQTARYLSEKMIDYLIGRKVSSTTTDMISSFFYKHQYDISVLVSGILATNEFIADESIGCKIKSPIELLVGISRLYNIEYKEPKVLIQIQRKLNQLLFFPPNVAGWTSGKGWIDSSTLMLRLQLSSMLLNFGVIEWDEKGDMPEQELIKAEKRRDKTQAKIEKRIKAYPDWNHFEKNIVSEENRLVEFLIQPDISNGARVTLENSDSQTLKDRSIEILSLPEYQLY